MTISLFNEISSEEWKLLKDEFQCSTKTEINPCTNYRHWITSLLPGYKIYEAITYLKSRFTRCYFK